jgi:hypothetical protein
MLWLQSRADGGCRREFSDRDLQHVRCHACGRRGHLSCASVPAQPAKLSCHNCGQGGPSAGGVGGWRVGGWMGGQVLATRVRTVGACAAACWWPLWAENCAWAESRAVALYLLYCALLGWPNILQASARGSSPRSCEASGWERRGKPPSHTASAEGAGEATAAATLDTAAPVALAAAAGGSRLAIPATAPMLRLTSGTAVAGGKSPARMKTLGMTMDMEESTREAAAAAVAATSARGGEWCVVEIFRTGRL